MIEFFKAYSYRDVTGTIMRRPFANRWLNAAIAWELVALAAVIYVPALQTAFGTFALSRGDVLMVAAVAVSIVPVLECVKQRASASPAAIAA